MNWLWGQQTQLHQHRRTISWYELSFYLYCFPNILGKAMTFFLTHQQNYQKSGKERSHTRDFWGAETVGGTNYVVLQASVPMSCSCSFKWNFSDQSFLERISHTFIESRLWLMPSNNKGLVFKLHLAHSETNVWKQADGWWKRRLKSYNQEAP